MRHEVEEKLPAVSGSSGHLVVERCKDEVAPDYPGRVFEDPELDYAAAMREFVSASAQVNQPEPQPAVETGPSLSHQAEIRQFHQAEDRLRQERREVRQRQAQEDAVWQTLSQQHQEDEADFRQKAKADRHQQRAVHQAKVELWKSQRDARRETLKKRQQEDADWRQQRQQEPPGRTRLV